MTELRWERTSAGADKSSSAVAFPVVRFPLPDGRMVGAQSAFGSNPPPAREGQAVTVLYDPDDPTYVRLPGFMRSGHFTGVLTIVIGAVFVVLGSLIGSVFVVLLGS